jgi:hypothetical protein
VSVSGSRRFFIPRSRRLSCDVLHFHRRAAICPHDRRCLLEDIDRLRRTSMRRISWAALMLKAYGLAAKEIRELRRAWLGGPVPTIYEHSHSVGMLAIEREHRGERWLFWGRFPKPEQRSLSELQGQLEWYQSKPVERAFRRQLQLSAIPNPLRRMAWWWNLNVSGAARARRAGTFFVTTLAGRGVEIQSPPAFHTGNLTYGPIDETGHARVTLAYDHRVFDGAVAAEALEAIDAALHGAIARELRSLQEQTARPARAA